MDEKFTLEQKMKGFELNFAVEFCLLLLLLYETIVVVLHVVLHPFDPLFPLVLVHFVHHKFVNHVLLRDQLHVENILLL